MGPLKVRVKRDQEENLLSSTCHEISTIYGRESKGLLVGSFKKEDDNFEFCPETALNFDIPFGMDFQHGEVFVKIKGRIPNGVQPTVKIMGIEDTSKKLISKDIFGRQYAGTAKNSIQVFVSYRLDL